MILQRHTPRASRRSAFTLLEILVVVAIILVLASFAVVGTITNVAGRGVYLQKKDKLFFCNATETPTSTTVATRYCKPVE